MKKKKHRLNKLLTLLLLLISIVLFISLFILNILTNTYLILIGVILLIVNIFNIRLLIKHKFKLSILYSFIIIILLSVISFYIIKTNNLLSNLNIKYKTYNYDVVVLKKSPYEEIEDIKGKSLGYYKTDSEETKKSLNKLKKVVETKNKKYNNTNELLDDLLNEKVEAILIEDSYLNILKENEEESSEYNNLDSKIQILYTFKISILINDNTKNVNITKEPFNIYISGIDTYGSIESVSRSDVNMVVTVNPKTKTILLTSIPRDYYVGLHNKSGYKDKLTHAGLYGVDMSINTIEDLLKIDINYYVKVNFTSIIDIVNSLGGLNVYSDYDFTAIDGHTFKKGYNSVDGEAALAFVRERKSFKDGDRQRVIDQQHLIEALIGKVTSKKIITKYNSLLDSLKNSFVTNMPTSNITNLLKMQMKNNYKWKISNNSLTGEDAKEYTYSYSSQKLYVMKPDKESVENANYLINKVMYGEEIASKKAINYNENDVYTSTKENKNTSSTNKTNTNTTTKNKEEDFKISLGKYTYSFTSGDEFIYHGFKVTLNNTDITNNVTYTFNVSGATFDNQSELINYMSSLSPGTYTIQYNITYNNITKTDNETVTIKEPINDSENNQEVNNEELEQNNE